MLLSVATATLRKVYEQVCHGVSSFDSRSDAVRASSRSSGLRASETRLRPLRRSSSLAAKESLTHPGTPKASPGTSATFAPSSRASQSSSEP